VDYTVLSRQPAQPTASPNQPARWLTPIRTPGMLGDAVGDDQHLAPESSTIWAASPAVTRVLMGL
jgi:hypothetical protein